VAQFGYRIHTTLTKPADLSTRGWNEITRRAHQREMLTWFRTKLRGHFTEGAKGKYGYKRRSSKYRKYKRRVKGHLQPIVYSGLTYAAAVGGTPLIRAFPRRATLTLNTRNYVKMRPLTRNAPNLGEEMTRLTHQETRSIEANEAKYMEKEIVRIRVKREHTAG